MLTASELLNEDKLSPTYNYLKNGNKSTNWTIDEGYLLKNKVNAYPIRGINNLSFRLYTMKKDVDDTCPGQNQGYTIFLHSPADIPTSLHANVFIPHDKIVTLYVLPSTTFTTPNLKSYKPERRQCYYSSERPLKYFKMYTESNCQLECLTNYTLHHCGHGWIHMPGGNYNKTSKVDMKYCWVRAEEEYYRYKQILKINNSPEFDDSDDGINDEEKWIEKRNIIFGCNCLPSCTTYTYDLEKSELPAHYLEKDSEYFSNYLTISFKKSEFIATKRAELYGQTDFLANVGGLIGLCLGFSVLSIIEIVYYLLRMHWRLLKRQILNVKITPQVELKY